jgi:hypothetical protein
MAWERSGVPGGSTRTSWFGRDVPAMWRLLENQQGDDHWRLVAGWRKASELTAAHLRHLEHYRTNLADVWPPDRNTAAAAYVARLDFLIQNVRTTHEVAAANYSTLAATVGALAGARRDLKPLYDEYVAKSRAIKDHADLAALNAAAEAPTVIGAAPAGPHDLERLNNRARAIMYSLSHTLIEAEAAIRQPPTYQPRTDRYVGDPDVYGSGVAKNAGVARPPDGSEPSRATTHEGHQLPRATPASAPAAADIEYSALPRATKPTTATTTQINSRLVPHTSDAPSTSSSRGGISRLISSDGIIGAPVHVPENAPAAREGRRVNPVGGVIGGTREKGLSASQSGAGQPAFGAFGRQPPERQRRAIDSGHAETHWQLAEGVPPVIVPTNRTPNADPGPAIGLDR